MSALVAKIQLDLKSLKEVQNLVTEAEVAAQLLTDNPSPELIDAAREGLESALEQVHKPSE